LLGESGLGVASCHLKSPVCELMAWRERQAFETPAPSAIAS
jgi:hypothetical protein